MMMKALMVGGVVLGLAGSPSSAQQPTTAEKADRPGAGGTAPEATFITKAAHANMAEVELGKLALEKAGSEEVKKFAQRMVDDHTKANEELKTLAQNKKFTLPDGPDPHLKAIQTRLSNLSGPSFDRAYMQTMIVDHRKAVSDFRLASKSAKDADVKGWAAKTLPTLEDHLKMAQATDTGAGSSGTKK
jgi:putative membrane protein